MPDEQMLAEEPMTETDWKQKVAQSFQDGKERMDAMQKEIQENTALTKELKADTAELLDVFKAVKGGLKVLGWIGVAAKWMGGLAAAGTAIYGFATMMSDLFHLPWPKK